MRDLYQEITDTIVSTVDEAGQWKPCWIGQAIAPENGVTGRRYNGINILILWIAAARHGWEQQRWATYRHWLSAGGQVKKGEKATRIVLRKTFVRNEGKPDEQTFSLMRDFAVFNAAQVMGDVALPPPVQELRPGQRFSDAEQLMIDTKITILNEGDQPSYNPRLDQVRLPLFERFHSPKNYYATAFHELGHATGHSSRLDRDLRNRFELDAYAMEELVAELTSAFVCSHLGIESSVREDHAPYIKEWLRVLKKDKGAIITAAAAAGRAADWIIGQSHPVPVEDDTEELEHAA